MPVFALLCQTARPTLTDADWQSLVGTLACLSDSDWAELFAQSLHHGTVGLLCRHLLDFGDVLAPETRQACAAYLHAGEARFEQGMRELEDAIEALTAQGIEAVVLKGPVLASQIYADATVREFRDLDILIPPEDRDETFAILSGLGYQSLLSDLSPGRRAAHYRNNGQDILFAPDRLALEPHWSLAPRSFASEIDTRGLIDRSVPVAQYGTTVLRGLAPEDALLAAALHGAKERWARLVWIADIAWMFQAWPSLDAHVALERARAVGCERMLLVAVHLAQTLLGATPPAFLDQRAANDPTADRLAATIIRRLRAGTTDTPSVFQLSAFGWQVRERPADRLRYAVRTLLTARTPHFRTVALPECLAFLYPAVRLGLEWMAWPAWKQLKRLGG